MVQHPTQLRKAKATAQREARILVAMTSIIVDMDVFGGTFALIKSSAQDDYYTLSIDESGTIAHAVDCTCDGYQHGYYCLHMEALDRWYQRIYEMHRPAEKTVSVEVAMAEAQAEMEHHIEQAAAESEASAERKLAEQRIGNFYEQRAQDFAYGCCGHIVFPERSGQLCGACLCK